MNEDDTFDALRRLPFEEANRVRDQLFRLDPKFYFSEHHQGNMYSSNIFKECTGWTLEEFDKWIKK